MRRLVLAVLMVVLVAMPLAASAQGPMGMNDDDDMMGMMSGMGGMGMMMNPGAGCGMAGSLGRLDLSDEQRTKINKIFDDLRKEHWPLMGKMLDERSKMNDLYDEDTLDAKKIGAACDAMHSLRKQMVVTKVEAINKVRALLTKEQLAKLKKFGSTRGMRGCGMGGGMGMGRGYMMQNMMMDK